MNDAKSKALFELSGFELEGLFRLENEYWPNTPNYYEIRAKSPWWLAITKFGPVKIGWRKRVIKIDWKGCAFRGVVTDDDVTKEETYVHAWSYAKAVEYMTTLAQRCKDHG